MPGGAGFCPSRPAQGPGGRPQSLPGARPWSAPQRAYCCRHVHDVDDDNGGDDDEQGSRDDDYCAQPTGLEATREAACAPAVLPRLPSDTSYDPPPEHPTVRHRHPCLLPGNASASLCLPAGRPQQTGGASTGAAPGAVRLMKGTHDLGRHRQPTTSTSTRAHTCTCRPPRPPWTAGVWHQTTATTGMQDGVHAAQSRSPCSKSPSWPPRRKRRPGQPPKATTPATAAFARAGQPATAMTPPQPGASSPGQRCNLASNDRCCCRCAATRKKHASPASGHRQANTEQQSAAGSGTTAVGRADWAG